MLTASEDVSFLGHNREVRRLVASQDGQWLASVAADNTVRVWDANDGRPLSFIASIAGSTVSAIAFSPDASRLGLLAGNRAMILDARSGQVVVDRDLGSLHSGIAFAGNTALYVGGENGALSVLSGNGLGGWDLRHIWQGEAAVRKLVASPKQRFLVLIDDRHNAVQFSLADAAPGKLSVMLPGPVSDIRFNASGSRMLLLGDRWVHRLSSSSSGLIWLDALLVPRALNGAGLVVKDDAGTSQRSGDEFYLPVARDSTPRLERFRFSDPVGPGLFGLRDELLEDWQQRLGDQ